MTSVQVTPDVSAQEGGGGAGGPSMGGRPALSVQTTSESTDGSRRPLRLALSVNTSPAGPISPSVASMMRGREAPMTPKSPANRRTSILLSVNGGGASGSGGGGSGTSGGGGGGGGGSAEWQLDSPKSPLFLRRRSANGGQPKSPSFTVSIPANDSPSPCCPSPLVKEERILRQGAANKSALHPDEEEREADQQERPGGIARKKSFLGAGMVPGPY